MANIFDKVTILLHKVICNCKLRKILKAFVVFYIIIFIVDTIVTFVYPESWEAYVYNQSQKYQTYHKILDTDQKNNDLKKVEVNIKDENFRKCLKNILNKKDDIIYDTDLHKIVYLDFSHSNIYDISGIEYCNNIEYIDLSYNKIKNIDSLSKLTKLKTLKISENNIQEIDSLKDLNQINELDLSSNNIVNIDALNNMKELKTLDLSYNNIRSVEPLKNLFDMKLIDVSKNRITNKDLLNNLNNNTKLLLDWGN